MSNLIEISHQELLDLLEEAFTSGLCSYSDLSSKVCQDLVGKFIAEKSNNIKSSFGLTTSYTTNSNSIDWNSDQLITMNSFIGNIMSS